MQVRNKLLRTFFAIWFVLLAGRLIYWQIFKNAEMGKLAVSQYGQKSVISARRGSILYSDGYPMAIDVDSFVAFVEPQHLRLPHEKELAFGSLFSASDSALPNLLQAKNSKLSWIRLASNIDTETKQRIEELNISGIGFDKESARSYPSGTSSAYLTGFLGRDAQGEKQGYFGLEGFYNRKLSGRPGISRQDIDALGNPIVIGYQKTITSQPGADVHTSIDRTVQYLLTKHLEEGLAKYQAKSGTIAIIETETGQILGMASVPSYDPLHYPETDPILYRNPIVSEGYEPGSTFKTIVMAAALDAKVISPDTNCELCSGPVTISGETVKNYNDKYYPNSSMTDVILHSDNVGMVYVGRKLGRNRLLDYLRGFGFGKLSGIDIQEEDTPSMKKNEDWYDIDWATASFGQGIAVTRIQMLAAVNTIANGGRYVPPRVALSDKPPSSKRIISPSAAATMTSIMQNGVEKGEVRYHRVPGYSVAGKTGTAQVPIAGHYDKDKVIASFVGFAPADKPKFTMLVTLLEPKTSPWGSTTAAPLWFAVARDLFRYFKIAPQAH